VEGSVRHVGNRHDPVKRGTYERREDWENTMSGNNGAQGVKEPETTLEGLIEAVLGGDISANDLVETVADGGMLEAGAADRAMAMYKKMQRMGNMPSEEDTEDNMDAAAEAGCPAPGSKTRSRGMGRGLARGRGRGPVGRPPMESDESEEPEKAVVPDMPMVLTTFESMVDEACGLKPKKKTKKKKSKKRMGDATESKTGGKRILEFAAPERQDVIAWARGNEPKRKVENVTPFWFDGDTMISKNVAIAQRNLTEKKAEVVHPKYLDAYTGRHAILANHGLRYCGYDVEIVDGL